MQIVFRLLNNFFTFSFWQSIFWLVAVLGVILIGFFAKSLSAELYTYLFLVILFVINNVLLIIFKNVDRVRLALLVFLLVLNLISLGYYYFSSITLFI